MKFKTENLKWSCYCVPRTKKEFAKVGVEFYPDLLDPDNPVGVKRFRFSSGEISQAVCKKHLEHETFKTKVTVDQYLDLINGNLYVPWRLEMDGFVAVNSDAKYPVYKKIIGEETIEFNEQVRRGLIPPCVKVYPENPMEQKGAVQLFDSALGSMELSEEHEELVPLFMNIDSYSKMILLVNLW
jgi:hypothetical protein